MAFVDNLGFELGVMVLTTAVAFYTGFMVWWFRRKNDLARATMNLRGGALMLGFLGVFLAILGFWGEFLWPLPGQYNVLFYDPTLFGGLLLIGFALLVYWELPTQYLGVVAGVTGLGIAYYGVRGYLLSLTKEPWEMLGLFLAFGLMVALAFPISLFIDWYVSEPAKRVGTASPATLPPIPAMWTIVVMVFLAFTAIAGVAAILMGFNTIWSHLEYAP